MKPDNIPGDLANPQSWNLYSYVIGNPVNMNDPTGHWYSTGPRDSGGGYAEDMFNPLFDASWVGAPGSYQVNDTLFGVSAVSPTQQSSQGATSSGTSQGLFGDFSFKLNPPAPLAPSKSNKLAERSVMFGEALINLEVARGKLGGAAVGLFLTPESGGSLGVAAGYLAWSAAGNMTAASFQLVGAVTGKTVDAEMGAKYAGVFTSAAGLSNFLVTHDIEEASRWAAREAIFTANPRDLFRGAPFKVAVNLIDWYQSVTSSF